MLIKVMHIKKKECIAFLYFIEFFNKSFIRDAMTRTVVLWHVKIGYLASGKVNKLKLGRFFMLCILIILILSVGIELNPETIKRSYAEISFVSVFGLFENA